MGVHASLREHLAEWAGEDAQKRAVAETVENLAKAGIEIAKIIALGPLAGDMASARGEGGGGDTQKELDFLANKVVTDALKASPVAWLGSEEDEKPVALNAGAPLAVNTDPLDGSSNIDTNMSIGTIFSILPNKEQAALLQPGRNQLCAGYIVYGPQTAIVLTVGQGTHIFWLDPRTGEFVLGKANVQIPVDTKEYAINSSNFRHWDDKMKSYIVDCKLGKDGPRQKDFNMRWLGSLVADCFRILTRGGIYLYPADIRKGYTNGRLRLLYEANPIGMLIEQAGGACTQGKTRMLDLEPISLHQHVPLVFGSKKEVEEVAYYYSQPPATGEHSPLFSKRGLFRTPR
ncbi:class 1 fructose-bisphosphatase [Rhodomicrobium lacus]|uniref:class 1 fructose-bisphosphatase n=1 Tax=Rhodomicrobium TaxID=1068 RepID=UPI0026E49421|nr:class 1 fructose-bisphosphatase [Rhodomicrobium lacus]WKW49397.1 class 1 fructose-bisphosphatase [Rhodomicrobium lacus]